jgi:hypothetical protein
MPLIENIYMLLIPASGPYAIFLAVPYITMSANIFGEDHSSQYRTTRKDGQDRTARK